MREEVPGKAQQEEEERSTVKQGTGVSGIGVVRTSRRAYRYDHKNGPGTTSVWGPEGQIGVFEERTTILTSRRFKTHEEGAVTS